MKVALISDVHANLPALEAVLAHVNEQSIDTVWNLGDLVGFGAYPDEVVQLLRSECVLATSGEYDRRVLRFQRKQDKWRRKRPKVEYVALRWAHDHLSKKSRKYLRFLSREERVTVKGHRILLTHGCPDRSKKPVDADTAEKELRKLAQEAEADIVLCGHSHLPLARQADDVWFVNPGSAGMGSGGDPRVSYCVLEISAEELEVQPFRIDYDVDRLVAALRKEKLPDSIARMFLDGQDLDAMIASGKGS
jgi:putative phosphoesterase